MSDIYVGFFGEIIMKTKLSNPFKTLSKTELAIWLISSIAIIISYLLPESTSWPNLIDALIGVTALIFIAKGNVFGQFLMVTFCIIYAFIALSFHYYGEMIIYFCMHIPICTVSIVTWLKNPNGDKKSEVKIAPLTVKKIAVMLVLGAVITTAFYFILKALGTANLIPSTISVLTSFMALYLQAARSPMFAAVFLANDLVLIIMWIAAAMTDASYLPMVICFSAFLLNDGYGFFNWTRMKKRQEKENA